MRGRLAALAAAALSLASCGEDAPRPASTDRGGERPAVSGSTAAEPTRTVEHFLAHPDELRALLQRCGSDPGGLAGTPDCVNALAARRQRTADEMKQSLQ